jgi:hypothetical protein
MLILRYLLKKSPPYRMSTSNIDRLDSPCDSRSFDELRPCANRGKDLHGISRFETLPAISFFANGNPNHLSKNELFGLRSQPVPPSSIHNKTGAGVNDCLWIRSRGIDLFCTPMSDQWGKGGGGDNGIWH